MSFSRPTLTDLRNQAAADIASNLPGADPLLRFANLKVLGDVEAALANGEYGYLDWIARMDVPFTATDEYLEAWAGLKAIIRRPATIAAGQATFTGTPGTILLAGTPVVRGDGVAYTVDADIAVGGGGTVVAALTAVAAGAAGNAAVATIVTLGTAISGLQSTGAVSTAIAGGADPESDDSLRTRMLQKYAAPPQGGARADYIEWARAVAGVTRAWVKPNGAGVGTVVVYIMLDIAEAAHGGFPQGTDGVATGEPRDTAATGDQLLVANYVFGPERQPVTALVYVVAPVATPVDFTISGIAGASLAVKAAIAAEIDAVFVTAAGPGGALDADGNVQGTVALSLIESAIAALSGTEGFVITVPAGNIVMAAGHLPTRGAITYVA